MPLDGLEPRIPIRPHNDKHSDFARNVSQSEQPAAIHFLVKRQGVRPLLCNPATGCPQLIHTVIRAESFTGSGKSSRLNAPPQRGLGDGHERPVPAAVAGSPFQAAQARVGSEGLAAGRQPGLKSSWA